MRAISSRKTSLPIQTIKVIKNLHCLSYIFLEIKNTTKKQKDEKMYELNFDPGNNMVYKVKAI